MTLPKITTGLLPPFYADLDDSLGFYRIIPGFEPLLCLSNQLLEGSEGVHLTVYRRLLDLHETISRNSAVYRLFPFLRYYEQLLPDTEGQTIIISENGHTHDQANDKESEIIILGRFKKSEHVCIACEIKARGYRLIG